jgi:CRISPR-associated protein Csx17
LFVPEMTDEREPASFARYFHPRAAPTSLGAYLAALGLLKVLSQRWPEVRAAWRDDVLYLVGGPADRDALADVLMTIADYASWTPYERGWADAQKASTKAKSGAKLALWQAEAGEAELELFAAHAAPASRVFFNPLLDSGGNAGKRAFADGWRKATEALQQPKTSKKTSDKSGANTDGRREALNAFLDGESSAWRAEKLNAASWFSDANKLYNSGQNPFSEGAISPWAMALACEGLVFFAGSASRRLGARTRPVGAFPFVIAAASPQTAGDAGRDRGEVWAPLWSRPMAVPEVVALFARGRAEIGGQGAVTPAAFAVRRHAARCRCRHRRIPPLRTGQDHQRQHFRTALCWRRAGSRRLCRFAIRCLRANAWPDGEPT